MAVLDKINAMFLKIFCNTPFNPYFIVFKNEKKTNERILKKFASGVIVDIGCGSANYKEFCLNLDSVLNYIGVDYPGWLNNLNKVHTVTKKLGAIGNIVMRGHGLNVTVWSDGTRLGIKSNCADTAVSFGVLEHIPDYYSYLSEIKRILKEEGYFIMTIPFLYESHGGEDCGDDFRRWTKHGIILELKKYGFKDIFIYQYGGVGTMFSQLINSYLIKKINIWDSKKQFYRKVLMISYFIPIFFIINLVCLFINVIDSDHAYAAGFHVIARK